MRNDLLGLRNADILTESFIKTEFNLKSDCQRICDTIASDKKIGTFIVFRCTNQQRDLPGRLLRTDDKNG